MHLGSRIDNQKQNKKQFSSFFLLNALKHLYHRDFATQDKHLCVYYITFAVPKHSDPIRLVTNLKSSPFKMKHLSLKTEEMKFS